MIINKEQVAELAKAVKELNDSADNTGCSDDLTVVLQDAMNKLIQLADKYLKIY